MCTCLHFLIKNIYSNEICKLIFKCHIIFKTINIPYTSKVIKLLLIDSISQLTKRHSLLLNHENYILKLITIFYWILFSRILEKYLVGYSSFPHNILAL